MYLLQNVYSSKESTSYIVSNKLFSTREAAVEERDKAVENALANDYSCYDDDCIDTVDTTFCGKAICGPDFTDVWFITNMEKVEIDDSDETAMQAPPEDYDTLNQPIVEVNPIEDIKFFVENIGDYDKEIKRMTDNGTYEKFLAEVHNKIDWGEVGDNMRTAENEAIAQSVDEVLARKASCENDLTKRQLAAETVDILDEYLFDKGIVIPCASESEEEDRKESDSCCALYGCEYWNLVDFLDNALTANTLSKDEIARQLLEEFESLLKSKNIDLQAFKKERGVLQNSISFIIS